METFAIIASLFSLVISMITFHLHRDLEHRMLNYINRILTSMERMNKGGDDHET